MLTGYLGTILTQTITYARDDFGASAAAAGNTLAAVRFGVLGHGATLVSGSGP